MNREDLLVVMEGHEYNIGRTRCVSDVNKHSALQTELFIRSRVFPKVGMMMYAKDIDDLKTKFNKSRYDDRTTRASFEFYILRLCQQNEHTHTHTHTHT